MDDDREMRPLPDEDDPGQPQLGMSEDTPIDAGLEEESTPVEVEEE